MFPLLLPPRSTDAAPISSVKVGFVLLILPIFPDARVLMYEFMLFLGYNTANRFSWAFLCKQAVFPWRFDCYFFCFFCMHVLMYGFMFFLGYCADNWFSLFVLALAFCNV